MEDKKEGSGSESCCSTSGGKGCCCNNKVVISIILGLLLFGAGYMMGKGGMCATKMCPMMQTQMPVAK